MADKEGYLLDTNHLIPLLREGHPDRHTILVRLHALPSDSPVCVATAALAELEVGCCVEQQGRAEAQAEIRAIIHANGLKVVDFTRHTAAEYGLLKWALMWKYNRRDSRRKAAKWPEVWTSPVPGKVLGVDEFDLLMLSHALERRLVLVTADPMRRILEGTDNAASDLEFQNWINASTA